jgi:integrase
MIKPPLKGEKKPKYVHAYPDRHGRDRIYYNKPGQKKIALRGPLYSKEFWIDYHKAEKGEEVTNEGAGATKTVAGTLDALVAKYYQSADFKNSAAATQRNYKSVLEPFRKEHGSKTAANLKREHINAILDKRAQTSTAQAKNLGKRLSTLMKFGVDFGLIGANPMVGVKKVKHVEQHYEMWEDEDIAMFREFWKAGTIQRQALEILIYTGLRRSDAVKLGPKHVKDGIITIIARKTGVELIFPVHPELLPFLKTRDNGSVANIASYLSTAYGKIRSEFSFTNFIIEAAKQAGLPPHRSPHGLRRASCRALAEAGCTVWEIMSITGHQNIKEVEAYVADINKKKLAKSAMAKWQGAS